MKVASLSPSLLQRSTMTQGDCERSSVDAELQAPKVNAFAASLSSNEWERATSYNEKIDIWQVRRGDIEYMNVRSHSMFCVTIQVGCTVHEILIGSLPFAAEDKELTAALILWADVNSW